MVSHKHELSAIEVRMKLLNTVDQCKSFFIYLRIVSDREVKAIGFSIPFGMTW